MRSKNKETEGRAQQRPRACHSEAQLLKEVLNEWPDVEAAECFSEVGVGVRRTQLEVGVLVG